MIQFIGLSFTLVLFFNICEENCSEMQQKDYVPIIFLFLTVFLKTVAWFRVSCAVACKWQLRKKGKRPKQLVTDSLADAISWCLCLKVCVSCTLLVSVLLFCLSRMHILPAKQFLSSQILYTGCPVIISSEVTKTASLNDQATSFPLCDLVTQPVCRTSGGKRRRYKSLLLSQWETCSTTFSVEGLKQLFLQTMFNAHSLPFLAFL